MELADVLAIHAVPHPDRAVRKVGLPLDHPYVEQCLSAIVGPSCTLFLRRLPVLWREREPAVVSASDLSRSLGLGGKTWHRNGRFSRTVDRLTQFGLAAQPEPGVLEVYVTVRPLTSHKVQQLPGWTQRAHDRLLDEHLARVAAGGPGAEVGPPTATGGIAGRLDRLAHSSKAEIAWPAV